MGLPQWGLRLPEAPTGPTPCSVSGPPPRNRHFLSSALFGACTEQLTTSDSHTSRQVPQVELAFHFDNSLALSCLFSMISIMGLAS